MLLSLAGGRVAAEPMAFYAPPEQSKASMLIDGENALTITGVFATSTARLRFDTETSTLSDFQFAVRTTGLTTANAEQDTELTGSKVFNSSEFPEISFKQTAPAVYADDQDTAVVAGILTAHGISKPISIDVKIERVGPNSVGDDTATVSMVGHIKRSDFQLGTDTTPQKYGDIITLKLDMEAIKN